MLVRNRAQPFYDVLALFRKLCLLLCTILAFLRKFFECFVYLRCIVGYVIGSRTLIIQCIWVDIELVQVSIGVLFRLILIGVIKLLCKVRTDGFDPCHKFFADAVWIFNTLFQPVNNRLTACCLSHNGKAIVCFGNNVLCILLPCGLLAQKISTRNFIFQHRLVNLHLTQIIDSILCHAKRNLFCQIVYIQFFGIDKLRKPLICLFRLSTLFKKIMVFAQPCYDFLAAVEIYRMNSLRLSCGFFDGVDLVEVLSDLKCTAQSLNILAAQECMKQTCRIGNALRNIRTGTLFKRRSLTVQERICALHQLVCYLCVHGTGSRIEELFLVEWCVYIIKEHKTFHHLRILGRCRDIPFLQLVNICSQLLQCGALKERHKLIMGGALVGGSAFISIKGNTILVTVCGGNIKRAAADYMLIFRTVRVIQLIQADRCTVRHIEGQLLHIVAKADLIEDIADLTVRCNLTGNLACRTVIPEQKLGFPAGKNNGIAVQHILDTLQRVQIELLVQCNIKRRADSLAEGRVIHIRGISYRICRRSIDSLRRHRTAAADKFGLRVIRDGAKRLPTHNTSQIVRIIEGIEFYAVRCAKLGVFQTGLLQKIVQSGKQQGITKMNCLRVLCHCYLLRQLLVDNLHQIFVCDGRFIRIEIITDQPLIRVRVHDLMAQRPGISRILLQHILQLAVPHSGTTVLTRLLDHATDNAVGQQFIRFVAGDRVVLAKMLGNAERLNIISRKLYYGSIVLIENAAERLVDGADIQTVQLYFQAGLLALLIAELQGIRCKLLGIKVRYCAEQIGRGQNILRVAPQMLFQRICAQLDIVIRRCGVNIEVSQCAAGHTVHEDILLHDLLRRDHTAYQSLILKRITLRQIICGGISQIAACTLQLSLERIGDCIE